MEMYRSWWATGPAAAMFATAGLLGGCSTFRSEPIRPEHELRALESRTPASVAVTVSAVQADRDLGAYHPEDGLDEAELVMAALAFNPDLRLRRYGGAAPGAASLFGLIRFKPELKVDVRSVTVGVAADSELLYTLLVPSLREAWRDDDAARRIKERAEMVVAELDLVREVRRAHVTLLAARRLVLAAEESRNRRIQLNAELAADPKTPPPQRALANLALRSAEAALRRAGDAQTTARQGLNRLVGFAPDQELRLSAEERPSAPVAAELPIAEIDRLVLADRWELKIEEAQHRRAEYRLAQAIAGEWPQLRLAPMVTYDRELGTSAALGGGVKLPWPERAAERVEAARTEVERARAVYVARLNEVRADAHAANDRLRRARAALVGPAEADAQAIADAWSLRSVTLGDYLAALDRLDAATCERLVVESDCRLAAIDLDHATGRLTGDALKAAAASASGRPGG